MAKSNRQRNLRIELSSRYDRSAEEKLAQAYRMLVPTEHNIDCPNPQQPEDEKERSHLCPGFLGSTEGTKHDSQSDRS